jgi:hypothetical protein
MRRTARAEISIVLFIPFDRLIRFPETDARATPILVEELNSGRLKGTGDHVDGCATRFALCCFEVSDRH